LEACFDGGDAFDARDFGASITEAVLLGCEPDAFEVGIA
jgi:hypothetical protein